MENLEQIIARQEKTFQDLKLNDTWYCGGNQDNVEILKEETWNWHRSSIKEILEGVKQELEKLREDYNEEHICRFNDKPQKCDCYGECLTNIINKLKVIIKK